MYRKYFKRILDFLLAILAMVILSPVFIITACLVRIKLGAPIIFKQQRPGLNEEIFILYKFRTMTDCKDKYGELLPDAVRLTRFGKLLRGSSLDELPELINILKGDMSIVGPRPLLVQYLPLYNEVQKRRHEVRPGLTGLAQVNGRNSISWEEKFDYDVKYINHISLLNDIRIVLMTVLKVFHREGINSESAATVEAFAGTIEEMNKTDEY